MEYKKIYLNTKDEDDNDLDEYDEITWCEDNVHGNGTPYVLESDYKSLQKELEAVKADRDNLFEYVSHLPDCPKFSLPFKGMCDCGLDELLKGR